MTGVTSHAHSLYLTNGSNVVTILDLVTYKLVRSIKVNQSRVPITHLGQITVSSDGYYLYCVIQTT
jgi:glutamine cyclotransferase